MRSRSMRSLCAIAALACACAIGDASVFADEKPAAPNQSEAEKKSDSWQQEFEDICAKTQDAMTLTVAELKSLVQRSDALEPRIEKLDETRRKVYLRRLKQCRGLYAYVLESKNDANKK